MAIQKRLDSVADMSLLQDTRFKVFFRPDDLPGRPSKRVECLERVNNDDFLITTDDGQCYRRHKSHTLYVDRLDFKAPPPAQPVPASRADLVKAVQMQTSANFGDFVLTPLLAGFILECIGGHNNKLGYIQAMSELENTINHILKGGPE